MQPFTVRIPTQIASPGGACAGFELASPLCPFLAQSGIWMGLVWSAQQEWGPCVIWLGLPMPMQFLLCPWLPMRIPHGIGPGSLSGNVCVQKPAHQHKWYTRRFWLYILRRKWGAKVHKNDHHFPFSCSSFAHQKIHPKPHVHYSLIN